jgi:hypothetical protein
MKRGETSAFDNIPDTHDEDLIDPAFNEEMEETL